MGAVASLNVFFRAITGDFEAGTKRASSNLDQFTSKVTSKLLGTGAALSVLSRAGDVATGFLKKMNEEGANFNHAMAVDQMVIDLGKGIPILGSWVGLLEELAVGASRAGTAMAENLGKALQDKIDRGALLELDITKSFGDSVLDKASAQASDPVIRARIEMVEALGKINERLIEQRDRVREIYGESPKAQALNQMLETEAQNRRKAAEATYEQTAAQQKLAEETKRLAEQEAERNKVQDKMRSLYEQTRTPLEKMQSALDELESLRKQGLSDEVYTRRKKQIEDEYDAVTGDGKRDTASDLARPSPILSQLGNALSTARVQQSGDVQKRIEEQTKNQVREQQTTNGKLDALITAVQDGGLEVFEL